MRRRKEPKPEGAFDKKNIVNQGQNAASHKRRGPPSQMLTFFELQPTSPDSCLSFIQIWSNRGILSALHKDEAISALHTHKHDG
jgi:hypothetical protein